MDNISPEVKNLLKQYASYKEGVDKIGRIERALAKAKVLGNDQSILQKEHSALRENLDTLSEAMTFANPKIWIEYKYRAYRDEAQPITTMHDLRVHCSKPGYICTKRLTFLNDYLIKKGMSAFSDPIAYRDDQDLSTIFNSNNVEVLIKDIEFMKQWHDYEYFKRNGKVAKWENF